MLKRIILVALIVLSTSITISSSASAAPLPIHVDYTASGLNDGTSWTNAYTDLQSALAIATSINQIWVAEGTYKPGSNRSDTFQLTSGVELYGGFPEGGGAFGERNWITYQTILDCDIGTPGDVSDNCYHVVDVSNTDSSTVLEGFYIQHGHADGGDTDSKGGGIKNYDGSPQLKLLSIRDNYAQTAGGMYNKNITAEPSLYKITFSNNTAMGLGGGMHNSSSAPKLWFVFFGYNSSGSGGGISNDASSPILSHLTMVGNSAAYGGGIYNDDGSDPIITNSIFNGNDASENGGGVYSEYYSSPTFINVKFFGNTAKLGGGMYNDQSDVDLVNVLFSGNYATDSGGGIYNMNSSDLSLVQVTLSGNEVPLIYLGGAMLISASTVTIDNSVIWGNPGHEEINVFMSSLDINYSVLKGGCPPVPTTCDHLINSDPIFTRPPSPGGDGVWGTSDDDYGDLHLNIPSPAIDAGDNTTVPADIYDLDSDANTSEKLPYDLDGRPRFVDVGIVPDTGNGTPPIVDMGAYETQNCLYLPLIYK